MSSTHIVLRSAAAAAVVLGSHYIVDALPLTRAAVRPSSDVSRLTLLAADGGGSKTSGPDAAEACR